MPSDSDIDESVDRNTRKRRKGVKKVQYQSERIKKSRVKNEEYRNWKGNVVQPTPHLYPCNCKKQCIPNLLTMQDAEMTYNGFILLQTKDEQDILLQNNIDMTDIKRRRSRRNGEASQRNKSFRYYVNVPSKSRTEVCRKAFLSAYGVTDDRIRRICKLSAAGSTPKDKRGKNTPGNVTPGHIVRKIVDHISSFPTKIAHYTTHEVHYLNPRLNVKIMWNLFIENYPDLKDTVKYKFYMKVFNENFDLKFQQPQVDTCCTCEELSVKIKSPTLNENAKRVAIAEKMVHNRRAKKFYSKLKEIQKKCNEDQTVLGVCMDFMQNLQLPVIPVQESFYLRQLTVDVFNIHELRNNTSRFCIYHEGEAKKGPDEVCSMLLDYIKTEIDQSVKELHVFSDGAWGQNKNHSVVRMLMALKSIGRFERIFQYFPIRGHSFLPCDRDFSVVKRKIKRTDRIYTMKEYIALIANSCSTRGKFTVKHLQTHEVLSFQKWWPKFFKKNVLSDESYQRNLPKDNKQPFAVSKFNQFDYCKDGVVVARDFIDGLTFHTFSLKLLASTRISLPQETLYDRCVPINVNKLNDIRSLMQYIPQDEEKQNFYAELARWPTL